MMKIRTLGPDFHQSKQYADFIVIIERKQNESTLRELLNASPAVGILGPRQVGKSTLAKLLSPDHFFDLENPRDLARLAQPQTTLEGLEGLICIDEVQRKPDLFPLLRYLIDQNGPQKFLILGSASRDLIQNTSETLAGRIQYLHLTGFSLEEIGADQGKKLWLRGGFPRSFLASSDLESYRWRENFVTDYLERDIPQLGIRVPSARLRRFWIMLSHYHGQKLNYAELARSLDVSEKTIRNYIDILASTFMVRVLQPWHTNTKKRLVKSPKLYINDSGIFHYLQSIETETELQSTPKLGASWEGYALSCVRQLSRMPIQNLYFWAVHGSAELDLFWQKAGRSYGIEFKYADAPTKTKSMDLAIRELDLEKLWVVYPGNQSYDVSEKVRVVSIEDLSTEI